MINFFLFALLEVCSLILIWMTSFFMIRKKRILVFLPFFFLGMGAGVSNYIFLLSSWGENSLLRYSLDILFSASFFALAILVWRKNGRK